MSHSSYLQTRLTVLGIDEQRNSFQATYEGQPQKYRYFSEDRQGNIEILYRYLDGTLQVHQKDKGKEQLLKVKRFHPDALSQKPELGKYLAPKGCGMRMFYPPAVIEAYQQQRPLQTLWITEGAFKAFKGGMHGLPTVGSMGIHTLSEGQGDPRLNQELENLIQACQVRHVVFLIDSDLFDLHLKEGKPANLRSQSFLSAAQRFKAMMEPFGVDAHLAYLKPGAKGEKLGLDDLLVQEKGKEEEVVNSLSQTALDPSEAGTWAHSLNLGRYSQAKLKAYFGLQSVEAFVEKYRDQLPAEFYFWREKYRLVEGKPEPVKPKFFPQLIERHGCYFTKGDEPRQVSNFTLRVKYLLMGEYESQRIVELANVNGERVTTSLPIKSMVSISEFQVAVESLGSFFWKGNGTHLMYLKEMVTQQVPNAHEVAELGYHPETGGTFFANGLYHQGWHKADSFGVVSQEGRHYYLPAYSSINRHRAEAYKSLRKFTYQQAGIEFDDWMKDMMGVLGENGFWGLCFYFSTLYRDLIHERLGSFVMLFLYGQKGSGKSVFMDAFDRLFRIQSDRINLGSASTLKGKLRRFAQFRNGMVMLDEFKNHLSPHIIEWLKSLYDGDGYERAAKSLDTRTQGISIVATCMIAGQELPTTEDALASRIIALPFFQDHRSEAAQQRYHRYKQRYEKGLTHFTAHLSGYRDLIETNYSRTLEEIQSELRKGTYTSHPPDRLIQNVASILAVPFILEEAKVIRLPYDRQKAFEVAKEQLEKDTQRVDQSRDVNRFWEEVETLYVGGKIIAGVEYRLDSSTDQLYIQHRALYQKVAENIRHRGGNPPMDQRILREYLSRSDAFLENKHARLDTANGSARSCMIFQYNKLQINLESYRAD